MRWFLVPRMVVVAGLPGAGVARGSAVQGARDQVDTPSAVVLVERLTTDEALEATGALRPEVAGFVSTLPVHQPLASRVLSLAAGRRVDAMDALEADPAAGSGLPGPATVERIRADNPAARFGRLPPTEVRTAPGMEAAGLFALGPSGPAPAPGPLGQGDQPVPLRPGQLLVLTVPDRPALAYLAGRLRWTEGAGPVMVMGLRAAPGLANTAPLVVLEQPGAPGSPGRAAAAARELLALTLALPSGYLLASMAEPVAAGVWQALVPGGLRSPGAALPWAAGWVGSGIAVAAALTLVALRLDRPASAGASRRRMAAPVLLGAVLLGLVVLDLALGGHGLSQPLIGGSAWDGERFYGLGNGYFAFALAAVMLVAAFAPLSAVATAAVLAGLGVVDGLPRLGAGAGGALTPMLTPAAAPVVLAPGRPRARRVVLLAGLAVAAAVVVALGAGLGGPASHAGRFAERLQQGPADAAGVVVDQLARNLRLLANSPFAWAGPLQVLLAGLIALRPPPPLRQLPGWTRRVLGLGAFGSLLLIVLNDTGVTATSASGLFLLAIPAWAWLDQHRLGLAGPAPPA